MGWIIFGVIAAIVVIGIIIAVVASSSGGTDSSSHHSNNFTGTSHSSTTHIGPSLTPEEIKGEWAENRIANLLNKISLEIPHTNIKFELQPIFKKSWVLTLNNIKY